MNSACPTRHDLHQGTNLLHFPPKNNINLEMNFQATSRGNRQKWQLQKASPHTILTISLESLDERPHNSSITDQR